MKVSLIAFLACLAPSLGAQAYCVQNDLKGREVRVVQEPHPSGLRDKRTLDVLVKPGERACCEAKNLDCNPEGKVTSNVGLMISITGDPPYSCGINEKGGKMVKVTGGGTINVINNPKAGSAIPFAVRVRTQDRDITGPSGLACN